MRNRLLNPELDWLFNVAPSRLGLRSSFGAMVDAAMSGISKGGPTLNRTPHAVDFVGFSDAAREKRLRAKLALVSPFDRILLWAMHIQGEDWVHHWMCYSGCDRSAAVRLDKELEGLLPVVLLLTMRDLDAIQDQVEARAIDTEEQTALAKRERSVVEDGLVGAARCGNSCSCATWQTWCGSDAEKAPEKFAPRFLHCTTVPSLHPSCEEAPSRRACLSHAADAQRRKGHVATPKVEALVAAYQAKSMADWKALARQTNHDALLAFSNAGQDVPKRIARKAAERKSTHPLAPLTAPGGL